MCIATPTAFSVINLQIADDKRLFHRRAVHGTFKQPINDANYLLSRDRRALQLTGARRSPPTVYAGCPHCNAASDREQIKTEHGRPGTSNADPRVLRRPAGGGRALLRKGRACRSRRFLHLDAPPASDPHPNFPTCPSSPSQARAACAHLLRARRLRCLMSKIGSNAIQILQMLQSYFVFRTAQMRFIPDR